MYFSRVLVFALLLLASAGSRCQKICFSRNGYIFVANVDGTNQKAVTTKKSNPGVDPSISPDGKTIVFTESLQEVGSRYIASINTNNGSMRRFKKIPGSNNHSPRFSPDGSTIVFNYFDDNSKWRVGVIDIQDTKFSTLTTSDVKEDLLSPVLTNDGNMVIANNLNNYLYGISLYKGQQEWQFDMDAFLAQKKPSFFNPSNFYYIKNKNSLLLMGETSKVFYSSKEGDESLTSIFLIDLNTNTVQTLTDDKLCVNYFCVDEDNGYIYAVGSEKKDIGKNKITQNIYRMNINGGQYEKKITNADFVSVSKY